MRGEARGELSTRIDNNGPNAETTIALEISSHNAAVAAAAAAAAPTGNTSEIKDAGTSMPPNDVGLHVGGPSDEVDGLI